MANIHRGEVSFEVGDETYTLLFNNNAVAELEGALGKPVDQLTNSVGVREIRAMLWAGLRKRHPRITLEKAGDILDEVGLEVAAQKALEAFSIAFPPPEAKGDSKNEQAAAGTGTQS